MTSIIHDSPLRRVIAICSVVTCMMGQGVESESRRSATESPAPINLGSRLELFFDDYLIESMKGLALRLHEPRSAGAVLKFDRPWEGITTLMA